MSDFNKAYLKLYPHEKGYQNNENDLGGETKYGISKKQYPNLDIADLSEEQAIEILKKDYWDHYDLSTLNSQDLSNALFIMYVNAPPLSVAMSLQLAIHDCGVSQINIDGILGSQTIILANSINPNDWLVSNFKLKSLQYYLGVVDSNISQLQNLRSWLRRTLIQ